MIFAQSLLQMGYITSKAGWNSNQVPILDLNLLLTTRRLSANVETDQIAYASVAPLTVSISRLGPVVFDYWLLYGTTGAGNGIGVQLAFSGAANQVRYVVDGFTAPNARADLVAAAAFGSGLAAYATGPGAAPANTCLIHIVGGANVTTPGDLNLQTRTSVAGQIAGLYASSFCQVQATD